MGKVSLFFTDFFCGALMLPVSALATDATVRFAGEIAAPTCELTAQDKDQTLSFDEVSQSKIHEAGSGGIVGGNTVKPFSFTFSGCYGVKNAHVALTFESDTGQPTHLKNTGGGRGVSFVLSKVLCANTTDTTLAANTVKTADIMSAAVVSNAATITGCAVIVNNAVSVVAGPVTSQVGVAFSYD